ncbi:hypothetical protein QE367_002965 [Microbacterium paludicola]|uniref:XRE family transcriptional regulator n=1 Tax=Microbacterium paludicola TaxID=300019 RepID=A0ABU1I4E1_9MICO|nr:hypothetical protein [Microbacterium paludicola]MDR6168761.1 hypothetical protein [Microbacterium paludicola]
MRAELERSGKTRAELAIAIAIAIAINRSRPTVSSKVAGYYPFRTDELAKAAAFLNCTVLELMQSALRQEAKEEIQVQDVRSGLDRRTNIYEQPPKAAAVTRRQAQGRALPTQ